MGLGLDGEDNVSTEGRGHAGLILIQHLLQGGDVDEEVRVGLPVVLQVPPLVLELLLEGAVEAGYGTLGRGVGGVGKDSSGRYVDDVGG